MADSAVWFVESNAKNKINSLKEKYNNIVKQSVKIGEILSNYVCLADKWNDENSEMFAKWWNQGGATGGSLKWNGNKLTTQLADGGSGDYDGEDRVKVIVQAAARTFWLTTCKPLASLRTSYSEAIGKTPYSICASNGEKKYIEDKILNGDGLTKNLKSTVLSDVMEEDFDCYMWKSWTLNKKMQTGKSKQMQLDDLIKKLSGQIVKIRTAVDEYCTEINSVLNNTDPSMWWGFDSTTIGYIKKSVKQIQNMAQKRLDDFANNTNEALSATLIQVNKDINTIGELNNSLIKS